MLLVGLGLALWCALSLILAPPASAHVDFLGSTPANVSTVDGPMSTIRFDFSGDADPITNEFSVARADGSTVPIASVKNDKASTIVVTTSEPMPSGRIKAVWALRGTDGHKMSGSVSFTVAAAPVAGTPSTVAGSGVPSAPADSQPAVVAVPLPAEESTATASSDGLAEVVAVVARWLVYGSILFVAGALAYLALVHRGTPAEGRKFVFLIRRASVLVIGGSLLEWVAQLMTYGSGSLGDLVSTSAWGSLLSSSFAIGTVLRLIGAALVLRFVAIDVVDDRAFDSRSVEELERLLDPDSAVATTVAVAPRTAESRVRVESGPLAIVGAVLLVASESFIGHTASVQPRVLVVVSDAVHLVATGVWVTGVWLLAWTMWRRFRRGQSLDAGFLAARFSDVATWALIAVTVSGLALSWAILRSPDHLWSTDFGRLLILKVILVAIIGSLGLHHRRVLVPELAAGVPDAAPRLRRTLMVESGLFAVVLLLTALLVAASPTS